MIKNRSLLICLIIILSVFTLATYNQFSKEIDIKVDNKAIKNNSIPNAIAAKIITLSFTPDGYHRLISVTYESEYRGTVERNGDRKSVKQKCEQYKSQYRCTFNFTTLGKAPDQIKVSYKSKPSNIYTFQAKQLKEKAITSLSSSVIPKIFALLVFLIPITWLIHKYKSLSQYTLLFSSISFLLYIQPFFTVILLSFLYCSYLLGTNKKGYLNKINKPLYILLFSITFLIFSKYFYSTLLNIFANPGNFNIFMPLGISYFIIRLIDTQLKWYRGEFQNIKLREYVLFVVFLPTLPAGPIETIDNFTSKRLKRISQKDILSGISRILIGLFQKLFIVDYLLAPYLFGSTGLFFSTPSLGPDQSTAQTVPLLILSLTFVYLDFSAYSNIAIGLSRLLGYQISENFNWPLLANTPREYWKRWHMTLSNWCMRNIYFPLLINTKQIFISSFMVMFVVGMWHAVSLSWGLWAIHHSFGIYLTSKIEKSQRFSKFIKKINQKALYFIGLIFTVIYISAGHAFAQYSDINVALKIYFDFWLQLPKYILHIL